MPAEIDLVVSVLQDLMERVKHLERGIVKTPRLMVNDELPEGLHAQEPLPIGSTQRHVTRREQEKMIELYRAGVAVSKIGKQLNWRAETIYCQLRSAGVMGPRKARKQWKKPHDEEPEEAKPKEDTEETAYV